MRYKNIASSSRHPFQVLILVLCLISSVPILLGASPAPASIEAQLPPYFSHVWALVLVTGSVGTLVGIFLKNRTNGLIMEQMGLAFIGISALLYSALIMVHVKWPGFFSATAIGVFAIACLVRWKQIQDYLHEVKKAVEDETTRGDR